VLTLLLLTALVVSLVTVNAAGEAAWLDDWTNRVKITVDGNDVAAVLHDFPVLLYLSNASGRNQDDVTFIFDELQSPENRQKIAVTTADGVTPCYVEIEAWDQAGEEAWLWAKIPSINSSVDTVLYLYYDSSQGNNTAYVGDTDSSAGEMVWDAQYVAVWHLAENATGPRRDSTAHDNDGTPEQFEGDEATGVGRIDGADRFDGSDDRIAVADSASLSFANDQLALEAWVKLDALPATETAILRKDDQWQIGFFDADTIRNLVRTTGTTGWTTANDEDYPFSTDTWYYWTFLYNGSSIIHQVNAQQVGAAHTVTGSIVDNANEVYVAYCVYSGGYLEGIVDEIRVSNTTRNPAWVKASYESGRDDLLAYGSAETRPRFVGGEIQAVNLIAQGAPYLLLLSSMVTAAIIRQRNRVR
jgi:hypothetical protein